MSNKKQIDIEEIISKGMVNPEVKQVDMIDFVKESMLDYAEETIINRAMQAIDGFKPVQRKVIYAMHNLGLDKPGAEYKKSAKIVGDTMANYHPHGDASIYGAACLLSDNNGTNNVPMIDGKGNLGLWYSTSEPAAMRYSEMKLTRQAAKCLEDIDKGEVRFFVNELNNLEPEYIPVKFPYILVNGANGVAVSIGNNIPSFKLENVCRATQEFIMNREISTEKLAEVIGYPSYDCGGYVHEDKKQLYKLIDKGTGRFIFEGDGECYKNMIVINEIPHGTTVEAIRDEIIKGIENGFFKGVKDVSSAIGYGTKGLKIVIKDNYSSSDVLNELNRLTSFRNPVTYSIKVVYKGITMKPIGIRKLLEYWVEFRSDCIKRLNTKLLEDNTAKENKLSAWEKIGDRIKELCQTIIDSSDEKVLDELKEKFEFTDVEAEYILGITLKSITETKRDKSLAELDKVRNDIEDNKRYISDEKYREALIIEQLEVCIKDFGYEGGTKVAEELSDEDLERPVVEVSTELVNVIISNNGCVKKLPLNNNTTFVDNAGNKEIRRFTVKNNGYLLIFDRFRNVTKVFVNDIESSRGKFVQSISNLANVESMDDIIFVDVTYDFSGSFNLIYDRRKGVGINYDNFSGRNRRYKAKFVELPKGYNYLVTKLEKFFIVTNKGRVVFCNTVNAGLLRERAVFVTGTLGKGEFFQRVIDAEEVPSYKNGTINIEKYRRGYPVLPKEDFIGVKGF